VRKAKVSGTADAVDLGPGSGLTAGWPW